MKKQTDSFDSCLWRVGIGIGGFLLLGFVAGIYNHSHTRNSGPKAAAAMERAGQATTAHLAQVDGSPTDPGSLKIYEDYLSDLRSVCRESRPQLIFMGASLTRHYQNAGFRLNNLDGLSRFTDLADRRYRGKPMQCAEIYSDVINTPARKLR